MKAEILGQIAPDQAAVVLQLYEKASCGFPSPAADSAASSLSIDELVGLREPSMFLARVQGDSMVNIGIYTGDVLIVDKAKEAKSGDVVMARVGSEFTVKTLKCAGTSVMLVPECDGMKPIQIGEAEELEVWGVCTWNLHQLTRR